MVGIPMMTNYLIQQFCLESQRDGFFMKYYLSIHKNKNRERFKSS